MTPEQEVELAKTLAALRARPRWRAVLLAAREKFPTTKPWSITRDEAQVCRWVVRGGNVALLCDEEQGLAVLDCDRPDLWPEMVKELGHPAEAWVLTGRDRPHFYVKWSPGLPAKYAWQDVTVGELQRGPNQIIVCPPSIHPKTGQIYRWLVDPATELLSPLPDQWLAHLEVNGQGIRLPREPRQRLLPQPPPDDDPYLQAALRQPGARRRGDRIKFQCAGCRDEGHDKHRDNAIYFIDEMTYGCALGPAHRDAVRRSLGILTDFEYVEAIMRQNDAALQASKGKAT